MSGIHLLTHWKATVLEGTFVVMPDRWWWWDVLDHCLECWYLSSRCCEAGKAWGGNVEVMKSDRRRVFRHKTTNIYQWRGYETT